MRRVSLSLIAAGLALLALVLPQSGLGPASACGCVLHATKVIDAIYKSAMRDNGKRGGREILAGEQLTSSFSKGFIAAYREGQAAARKRWGQELIDFDPVTASQNPSTRSYRIALAPAEGRDLAQTEREMLRRGAVTVLVKLVRRDDGTKQTIAYDLVLDHMRWKIDNIRTVGGDDGWDLRKMASRAARGDS